MYRTLIQMPGAQWCLIFKDNSTALPIHVGRWRFTGSPGTHSSYHGRCWGVEAVRLFQSPGFYPLHSQMSYSNDKWFFSFFNMTSFSRFPTPYSFTAKNTYKIRTTARCSLLLFSTWSLNSCGALSPTHNSSNTKASWWPLRSSHVRQHRHIRGHQPSSVGPLCLHKDTSTESSVSLLSRKPLSLVLITDCYHSEPARLK